MKKILLLIVLLIGTVSTYAQHAAMYSHYMFNGLIINPAYAGSNNLVNATVLYRNQWVGFEGAPKTFTLSVHSPLKNKNVNLGFNMISDHLGVASNTKINFVYAYRIKMDRKSYFSFGLQGGLNVIRNSWSEAVINDPDDDVFLTDEKKEIPEAGFGMFYYNKKLYAGFSIPTLITFENNEASVSQQNNLLYKPFILTSGYIFDVNKEFKLKPSFLIKYIKGSPLIVDLNSNLYYKEKVGIGISYRTKDAIVLLLDWQINQQFILGYAFDLTLSELAKYNKGTHEIMLKYEFGYKVNIKSPRYFF